MTRQLHFNFDSINLRSFPVLVQLMFGIQKWTENSWLPIAWRIWQGCFHLYVGRSSLGYPYVPVNLHDVVELPAVPRDFQVGKVFSSVGTILEPRGTLDLRWLPPLLVIESSGLKMTSRIAQFINLARIKLSIATTWSSGDSQKCSSKLRWLPLGYVTRNPRVTSYVTKRWLTFKGSVTLPQGKKWVCALTVV